MTKVRVQDVTKELSANTGKMLEDFTRMRKQSQDMLNTLRRISDGFVREEKERQEREAKEELRKQYEASAQFMTAYSSEQVPDIPAQTRPEAQPRTEAAAPVAPEAPAASVAPVEKPAEKPAEKQPVEKPAEKPVEKKPAPVDAPKAAEFGVRVVRTARQESERPMQQRPAQGAQRPAYPARPAQPGQRPAYGDRPQRPQQGGPRPGFQGRPAQPGAPGQRPAFGSRPAGGAPGQGPRPGGFGNRPAGGPQGRPAGGMGGGVPRTGGFGGPRGGSFGRRGPDIAPTMEKERVSNYDPNKKQYVRQNDPERNRNAGGRTAQKQRGGAGSGMVYDDEFVRGRKKKKAAVQKTFIEPTKIEKAYMTAETITVRDLSERIGKPAGEIIKKLMMLGIIATINNDLDFDTATLVAQEFGVELEMKLAATAEDALEKEDVEDTEEELVTRPPVVTIMGHVDHGKTSLLDYIRKTRVTAGEAGGITQHIGAYTVELDGRKITFLDTPGHEAFTSMRLRGAQATDIAVLVVAADDGVMPQTIEAINHAKSAGVEIIVAINKMDKPAANPEHVKQQLTEYELVTTEWGGSTEMVPVSAVTGQGVDDLLETILLTADVNDYRANPNRKARGIIIEAKLDKGRGPVATVLVKNGTLNVGDAIVAGTAYGHVRAMVNDRGERVKSAGPSEPVEVIGFNDVPDAGDQITAVDDEKLSRQVAEERKDKLRAALVKTQTKTTLDDLFNQISAGEIKDLNVIIKADVQGSVEAVRQSLEKLSNDEVRVRCIHGAVGAINESDTLLASTANAIIIGFNVRPDNNARDMAEREKIDIRLYRVIYQAIEDVEAAMKGMLAPKYKEVLLGHATVRQPFKVSGVGTIAGSYVTDGKIARNAQIRLLRDNIVIHEGKIDSLKRFKDDAKEVNTGYECGIGIENYNDIKEGDVIECFVMEEIER
ncbi:MAG: translation initiation factor IF-2 [Clostridia bacterium]|nr:translation initiation factor IF-2 [Clostridia bacterium]